MAKFELVYDSCAEPVPINAQGVTIGRSEIAVLRLTDRSVSRLHALVWEEEGILVFKDLGSSNGTRVNGMRLMESRLVDGDRISVGDTDLFVVAAESIVGCTTLHSDEPVVVTPA